ncbi:membrane protein [Bifidobacterium gallicum DSM 20093 = LMG 11596]|nr:ECF transporter S component [Bifidobacterium gallicum]KFI58886.1 membrane protein [Bifidobacterium gallicum DSM 20093 = LMG 11596]
MGNSTHATTRATSSANTAESSTQPLSQATRPDTTHSTGVGDSGRWSTKRIAIYALFSALAMAVSFIEIPLMPAAPWLKYDPSGIVCLLAGFAFGPSAAAIVSVIGFLPHVFSNPFGTIMAIIVALALSVPAALIYRGNKTRARAVVALAVGSLCALVAAIVCNLFITPLYAHMSIAQVAAMIVPILLPFNLIKFAIHDVVTFLIYKPVSKLVGR